MPATLNGAIAASFGNLDSDGVGPAFPQNNDRFNDYLGLPLSGEPERLGDIGKFFDGHLQGAEKGEQ